MPTYEYACTACDHRLEAVQSFSDEPLTSCPECGGVLRKVYGAVGIVLKGSGFYKTDSRAASNGDGRKATPAESSGSDSPGSASGSQSSQSGSASSGSGSGSGSESSGTGSAPPGKSEPSSSSKEASGKAKASSS